MSIRSSWIQGALQINPIGNSFSVWPIEIYFLMFYCKGHITNKPFTLEGQAWHYPSLQKAIMGFKSKAWMSWWGKRKRRRKHSFCSSRLFILMLLLQRTFLHYNSVRTMSSFVSCHAQMICTPFIHVMLKMSLCLIWVGWKGPVTLQVWDHQTFKSSPDPKLLVYYL